MLIGIAGALALLLLQATPTAADGEDFDEAPRETFEARQVRVRTELGVAELEAELAVGVEVYRAFFIDGYNRDLPAVAFERRPGQSPQAVVYGWDGRRMTAAAPVEAWDRVRERSEYADREFAPLELTDLNTDPDLETIVVCIHGWTATVEIADGTARRPTRRRTENACEDGVTVDFAFELAAEAVTAVPGCARLDPEHHRNNVERLAACFQLEGDVFAAADLQNVQSRFDRMRSSNAETKWSNWIGHGNPRIDWAGQVVARAPGDRRHPAPAFLAAREAELGNLYLYPARYLGETSLRVRIDGELVHFAPGAGGESREMVADYWQTWTRNDPDSGWRLESWTVSPFRPHVE